MSTSHLYRQSLLSVHLHGRSPGGGVTTEYAVCCSLTTAAAKLQSFVLGAKLNPLDTEDLPVAWADVYPYDERSSETVEVGDPVTRLLGWHGGAVTTQ